MSKNIFETHTTNDFVIESPAEQEAVKKTREAWQAREAVRQAKYEKEFGIPYYRPIVGIVDDPYAKPEGNEKSPIGRIRNVDFDQLVVASDEETEESRLKLGPSVTDAEVQAALERVKEDYKLTNTFPHTPLEEGPPLTTGIIRNPLE